jgi:hypothetical protein
MRLGSEEVEAWWASCLEQYAVPGLQLLWQAAPALLREAAGSGLLAAAMACSFRVPCTGIVEVRLRELLLGWGGVWQAALRLEGRRYLARGSVLGSTLIHIICTKSWGVPGPGPGWGCMQLPGSMVACVGCNLEDGSPERTAVQ